MGVNLLNDNQQRRIGTHLRLLMSDLDALAEAPELKPEAPAFATVREAIAAARRAAEQLRGALALPAEQSPTLARRVGAVAEIWWARMDDLRARQLAGYGPVHPDLAGRLDPGVEMVRQSLEALAAAARRLPHGDPGNDR